MCVHEGMTQTILNLSYCRVIAVRVSGLTSRSSPGLSPNLPAPLRCDFRLYLGEETSTRSGSRSFEPFITVSPRQSGPSESSFYDVTPLGVLFFFDPVPQQLQFTFEFVTSLLPLL